MARPQILIAENPEELAPQPLFLEKPAVKASPALKPSNAQVFPSKTVWVKPGAQTADRKTESQNNALLAIPTITNLAVAPSNTPTLPGLPTIRTVRRVQSIVPPVSPPLTDEAKPVVYRTKANPVKAVNSPKAVAATTAYRSTGLTPIPNVGNLTSMILTYNRKLGWDVAHLLAEAILNISHAHAVDYRLLAGVVAVESSFRSDAISSSGAIGLGQLKPATAQWLGISNPFDPLENMVGVSRYLRFLINRYNGDLDSALAAYFQGQGTIDRNGITEACLPYLYKINDVIHRF